MLPLVWVSGVAGRKSDAPSKALSKVMPEKLSRGKNHHSGYRPVSISLPLGLWLIEPKIP